MALPTPPDRALARLLAISAGVVLFTVVAWLVSLGAARPSGEVSEQLAALGDGMVLYRWAFANAALINPAFVVMLFSASALLVRRPVRPHEGVGALLIGTYWLLPTLAYVSQFALLPRLLGTAAAGTWYFGDPASVSYWLAMTGYGLFGVGAVLSASRFLLGGARAFGWVLLASGVTSGLGLVGYSLADPLLESAAVLGGGLVVPLAVLAMFAARGHRATA